MSKPDELRGALMHMASEVREMVRAEAEKTAHEELHREALAAFVFGMVTAAGRGEGLAPEELHELTAVWLHEALLYFPEEAGQLVRELISAAADAAGGGTAGAVIRQGVDGYGLWKNRETETLRGSLTEMLTALEGRDAVKDKTFAPRRHGDTEKGKDKK